MIQLNLNLTPTELIAVGIALGGQLSSVTPTVTADVDDKQHTMDFVTDDKPESTVSDAVIHPHQGVYQSDKPEPPPIDTDADGMPWDARIHASTRAVNADGRWKKRRGVDDVEVTRVEMEIGRRVPPPPTTIVDSVPPPPTTNRSTVTDFVGLMGAVTSKGIDMAKLQAEVMAHGLNTIAELPARPDLVNSIATALGV